MKAIVRSLVAAGLLVLLIACVPASPSAGTSGETAPVAVQTPAIDSRKLPKTLGHDELVQLLADKSAGVLLVDVRTLEEFNQGHIAGATLSPYNALETMFKEQDKSRPIVLYCRSGNRSSIAMRTLTTMGYTNVADFGGLNRWRGNLARP